MVSETKGDDTLTPGALVRHPRFGSGVVEFDKGATTIVRFDRGLEECERGTLDVRQSLEQAIAQRRWSGALEVVTKAQAAAIVSLNDAWGVFSRSRISLLPHQLWVCHRVLRQWPARFLIADDVGLGKTIEAGLILWPLLSKQLVRRLLILCPASLVEQWQFRLRDMFDIRLHRYLPELDTDRGDFWGGHAQVVASLTNATRRQPRTPGASIRSRLPWDLLIVDEAHHLNADERALATLGYRLVDRLISECKAESCLFFTGTPHRGKPYGFWALLRLLRPDLFDPSQPDEEQFPRLHEVLIRNNKQTVTDMRGAKLFKPVNQFPGNVPIQSREAHFYRLLTEFIATGRGVRIVAFRPESASSDARPDLHAEARLKLGRGDSSCNFMVVSLDCALNKPGLTNAISETRTSLRNPGSTRAFSMFSRSWTSGFQWNWIRRFCSCKTRLVISNSCSRRRTRWRRKRRSNV